MEPDDGFCIVCEVNAVKARDRCGTCLQYLRRKGHDRPKELAKRQAELNRRPDPVRANVIRQLVRVLDIE